MPVREHTFRVTRTRSVPVTTYRQEVEVIYEGDDWLEAEEAAHDDTMKRRDGIQDGVQRFEGVHPTHPIGDGRCEACGAPENGCFKIHAPCGFDMGDKAILTIKREERARRDA